MFTHTQNLFMNNTYEKLKNLCYSLLYSTLEKRNKSVFLALIMRQIKQRGELSCILLDCGILFKLQVWVNFHHLSSGRMFNRN